MLIVLTLAIGTVIGEILRIEKGFERFGEWLKEKTGNSGKLSVASRIDTDILRRFKSCVGKEDQGCKYATCGAAGGGCGVYSVGVLIRNGMTN